MFLILSLKTQITSIYQCPDFVELLQKLSNQANVINLYIDIYDREVWKTFSSFLDNPETQFFTNEMADSYLEIIINLDWF